MRFLRDHGITAGIAVGISVLLLLTLLVGLFDWLEVLLVNTRFSFRGDAAPAAKVVIVGVDDRSVSQLGEFGRRWREFHGQLVKNLADAGAKVVGFDIAFSGETQWDQPFLEGIRYARDKGTDIVVGAAYDDDTQTFSEVAEPIREGVTSVGHSYLEKDRVTHQVRWAQLLMEYSLDAQSPIKTVLPAFAAEIASLYGIDVDELSREDEGRLTLNYRGGKRAFRRLSYADVYQNKFPPEAVQGNIVLVGSLRRIQRDIYETPVGELFGVEIHANVLSTMMEKRFIVPGPLITGATIVALSMVAAVICTIFPSVARILLLAVAGVGYVILGIVLFTGAEPIQLNVAYPLLALILTWGGVSLYQKKLTGQALTLAMGLSAAAHRKVVKDLRRGPLRKPMTILASDIADYSKFSKDHPPEYTRELVNEYLKAAEEVIYKNGGYVNKYIGDAILAVFGYPMAEDQGAKRAVQSAFMMQAALARLLRKWEAEGKESFQRIRIGVSTGEAVLSYLGESKEQLDVLGPTVDLAARLESAGHDQPAPVLVCATTYQAVQEVVLGRAVPVELKNRPDVKEAYALDALLAAT